MANQGTILIGPWGVPKRNSLKFEPGTNTSITEIEIGHKNVVHLLKFKSFDHKAKLTKQSEQWGTGLKDATITFGPTEYLTKISGTTTKINEKMGKLLVSVEVQEISSIQ
ncbi:hypothetical protein LWI29_011204 [Acer saccharum]|uniref:Jacalin-type lectin domain-containing protein n=1 Tax=Acer saccharum TaxID=4024 RepID=A0AA39SKJ6_ACESA|nr:hypothetical protein LWI29_011204 [Acer saccharum]